VRIQLMRELAELCHQQEPRRCLPVKEGRTKATKLTEEALDPCVVFKKGCEQEPGKVLIVPEEETVSVETVSEETVPETVPQETGAETLPEETVPVEARDATLHVTQRRKQMDASQRRARNRRQHQRQKHVDKSRRQHRHRKHHHRHLLSRRLRNASTRLPVPVLPLSAEDLSAGNVVDSPFCGEGADLDKPDEHDCVCDDDLPVECPYGYETCRGFWETFSIWRLTFNGNTVHSMRERDAPWWDSGRLSAFAIWQTMFNYSTVHIWHDGEIPRCTTNDIITRYSVEQPT
jgi:hypothetical protein